MLFGMSLPVRQRVHFANDLAKGVDMSRYGRPKGRGLPGAALAVALVCLLPSQAIAQGPEPLAEPFTLIAAHSRKCLDVAWSSPLDGAGVVQSRCVRTANQIWKVDWKNNVHNLRLRVAHSDMCLGVQGTPPSQQHGARIVQRACDGSDSQIWHRYYIKTSAPWFFPLGEKVPYYVLVNERSRHCLDVAWSSLADDAEVVQAMCTATDNQLWDFAKVD
jgi:hypothetical protein